MSTFENSWGSLRDPTGFADTTADWLDRPPTQEELAQMRSVVGDEQTDEMMADLVAAKNGASIMPPVQSSEKAQDLPAKVDTTGESNVPVKSATEDTFEVSIPRPDGKPGSLRKTLTREEHYVRVPEVLRYAKPPGNRTFDIFDAEGSMLVESVSEAESHARTPEFMQPREFHPDGESFSLEGDSVADGTRDWRSRWKGRLSDLVADLSGIMKELKTPDPQTEMLRNAKADRIKFETEKKLRREAREGGVAPEFLQQFLDRRKAELDAEAKKYGGSIERWFSKIGEGYNSLHWKWKVGAGAMLGVGGALSLGVSLPLAALFGGGLAAQRVLGMAGKFVEYNEKFKSIRVGSRVFVSNSESGRKALALVAAATWSGGIGVAVSEAAQAFSNSSWGEGWGKTARGFLEKFWPSGVSGAPPSAVEAAPAPSVEAPVESPAVEVPSGEYVPEQAQGFETSAAPDESGAPSAPEVDAFADMSEPTIPEVEVTATPGKGYEFMMKRMWEQLQEKGLDASHFPEGSDVRKLLEAGAQSVDSVVHQIALDPKHAFVTPNGVSAVVKAGARIALDAAGNIKVLGG